MPRKNYQQWTDSVFLATVYLPIHPLTYLSNTMSRKLLTKTTFEMHYIFLKLRYWVVVKEDDKTFCHKKGVYINIERDRLYGNVWLWWCQLVMVNFWTRAYKNKITNICTFIYTCVLVMHWVNFPFMRYKVDQQVSWWSGENIATNCHIRYLINR